MTASKRTLFCTVEYIVHNLSCTLITNYSGECLLQTPPFLILRTMPLQPIKTGKKGGVITYRVGDTILAREYNPHPANPKTQKQVAQRAKIKLLSQIAAVFRPIIAIFPTSGKSSRAIFARLNYQKITVPSTTALIDYASVSLTDSTRPITQVTKDVVFLATGVRKLIGLPNEPTEDIKRVFYYLFSKTDNGKLCFVDYYLSEIRWSARNPIFFCWANASFDIDEQGKATKDYVVYALGMGDNSEEATTYWQNLDVPNLELLGQIIAEGLIKDTDYYFTETTSFSWFRGT